MSLTFILEIAIGVALAITLGPLVLGLALVLVYFVGIGLFYVFIGIPALIIWAPVYFIDETIKALPDIGLALGQACGKARRWLQL